MSSHRKTKIGIALGSGAARGWAHLGVLEVLEERGLAPEVVAGTSIGAVVGAAYALRELTPFREWVEKLERRDVAAYFDLSLRGGLIRARRVFNAMSRAIPERSIESFPIPFAAVATDLETGHELWLRHGSMYEALRASTALPGLISPSRVNGRWLVDGGLTNPVPVSVCRALGADFVIAVDLNTTLVGHRLFADGDHTPNSTNREDADVADVATRNNRSTALAHPALDSIRTAMQDFGSEIRHRVFGDEVDGRDEAPSIYDVVTNSIHIMQALVTRSRMASDPPDLQISPQLGNFGLLDFDRADEAMAEGRRATEQALDASGVPEFVES
jgi:NTE family protein